MSREITIIPKDITSSEVETNLSVINNPLDMFLKHYDLPTDDIFSPIAERRKIITSLDSVFELLAIDKRKKANYLSKFTVSVSLGMFDGALAFLWDETIRSLRTMVIEFDLNYFYSIASSMSSRYKGLSNAEDIEAISEHDLLEISRRMGVLSDINQKRLEQINYFRNHASSAHPNENELSGLELVSFLENCIKYVINAEYDESMLQIKKLFEGIRHEEIDLNDVSSIIDALAKLQQDRINDFTLSLFGLYCDIKTDDRIRENIDKLSKGLWKLIDEDIKYKIGAKFGYYRIHVENQSKDLVQRFLHNVNGNLYKDEDSLATELIEKIQNLRTAHYGSNNFYNEYTHALSIQKSIPSSSIPVAAKKDFVKIISICYIGNGLGYREGVDERALPYYEKFVDKFYEDEIKIYLQLFSDHEFIGDLDKDKVKYRAKLLTQKLLDKTENLFLKKALQLIIDSPRIDKVSETTAFKTAILNIS